MENQTEFNPSNEANWKSVYKLGAISTIIVLIGIFADVIIGNITGGDLTALPQTAVERFHAIHTDLWKGLYELDLLNMINQILFILSYFAILAAHRKTNLPYSLLAFILFIVGTTIFIINNAALPMIDLANKYFASTDENQKLILPLPVKP